MHTRNLRSNTHTDDLIFMDDPNKLGTRRKEYNANSRNTPHRIAPGIPARTIVRSPSLPTHPPATTNNNDEFSEIINPFQPNNSLARGDNNTNTSLLDEENPELQDTAGAITPTNKTPSPKSSNQKNQSIVRRGLNAIFNKRSENQSGTPNLDDLQTEDEEEIAALYTEQLRLLDQQKKINQPPVHLQVVQEDQLINYSQNRNPFQIMETVKLKQIMSLIPTFNGNNINVEELIHAIDKATPILPDHAELAFLQTIWIEKLQGHPQNLIEVTRLTTVENFKTQLRNLYGKYTIPENLVSKLSMIYQFDAETVASYKNRVSEIVKQIKEARAREIDTKFPHENIAQRQQRLAEYITFIEEMAHDKFFNGLKKELLPHVLTKKKYICRNSRNCKSSREVIRFLRRT